MLHSLTLAVLVAQHKAKMLTPDDSIAIADIVHAHVAHSEDIDVDMAGEGAYAVGWWKATSSYKEGSALVRKTKTGWILVKMLDRKFTDAATLQKLGVPKKDAENFVLDFAQ